MIINYYMHGYDLSKNGTKFINNKEKIAVKYSNNDTSIHKHDFIEIVYFYSGIGTHIVNGKSFQIGNGSLCIINSQIEHCYHINKENDKEISVINIIFYPSIFGQNISKENFIDEIYKILFKKEPQFHRDYIQINYDYNKDFFQLFQIINNELMFKEDNYINIIKQCLTLILLKIFRLPNTNKKKPITIIKNIEIIEDAINFINNNYSKNLTISSLSKTYNFSNIYFNTLFKNYTGTTFKKYLQKIRCDKAIDFLINTDKTVTEICTDIEYSDPKQFYMLFKRHTGMTPLAYKAKKLNINK